MEYMYTSTINELTSRKQKSSQIHEINLNGCIINDSYKISEEFNKHFASIGPNLAVQIPSNVNGHSHFHNMTSQTPSRSFVLKRTNNIVFKVLLFYLNYVSLIWV